MHARIPGPARPAGREVGQAPLRHEAGQPGQQAQVQGPRRRHRPGRRLGGRVAGRAGLQRRDASASRTRPGAPTRIAAQGGINAAKNYQNDGDSVYRLFYDTIKGGDFRSREANVYRLAQVSVNIIDQCVAQGVPFAREYGGQLDNRSFGGAQVSRTFYCRGQTGQQLLLGAYSGPVAGRSALGHVKMHPRTEMLDLVVVDGQARGIVVRDLVTGQDRVARRRRRGPGDRRLRPGLLPVHQRHGLQRHRHLPRLQARGRLRQPLLHADPPDLHPRHRRPPVEADADVRVAAQRRPHLGAQDGRRQAAGRPDPRGRARLLPGAQVPELRQPGPARHRLARGQGGLRRGPRRRRRAAAASTSTSPTPSAARGEDYIREKYGNLFDMYAHITDENPYKTPMRIYPAVHYMHGRPVGGLQPDEQRARPVRAGRGQLLRPRRQPPRRQRPDAGAGRRLLHRPVHHRQLPRRRRRPAASTTDHAGVQAGRGRGRRPAQAAAGDQGQADGRRRSTASWAR